METGHTVRLARFAHELKLSDIPPDALEKVKVHVLDQLGNQLIGGSLPWNRTVRDYSLKFAPQGKSAIVGTDDKIDAEFAALANGTAGHGAESDDYHAGLGHPGCVAVPAALAVAEEQGASGADFLVAAALAFEFGSRVGLAVFPAMLHRGFQTTGPTVFGAGAAAAWLMRLNETQMRDTLAVAGSHASGVVEYAQTAGEVKRLHAGMMAAAGIRSARIVSFGMTGPPTILEGKKGYLNVYSDDPHPERLTAGLGEKWELLDLRIKPYACCGIIFQQIDALKKVLAEHPVSADEIKEIWVGADRITYMQAGNIGPEPKDMTGAQFSTHFSLGMTIAKGQNDFGTYLDAARDGFRDPDILKIAHKVRVEPDAYVESQFLDRWMAKLTLTTVDGRTFTAEADGRPKLSRAQVEDKFRQLAGRVMPADRIERVIEEVNRLERLETLAPLTELLRTSDSALLVASV